MQRYMDTSARGHHLNIDVQSLRAFSCLASELNFSRAAAALHISASRLTRTIQTLEKQVGVKLLVRTTHNTALTAEGVEFLSSARRIVAEADWVGRRFATHRPTSPSTFTVGCLAGSLYEALPERIRAARAALPKMQIRLVETDEEWLANQVLSGQLDMGFLYFPTADDEMACKVVSRRPQLVAMAPDHPLAGRKSLLVKELAGHSLILPDEIAAPRLHRWYRSFLDKGGSKSFHYVGANQIHVALGLCAAGEGLCVVAEPLRRMRDDDLRYVPLRDAPKTELAAIWRKDSPVREVARFIANW